MEVIQNEFHGAGAFAAGPGDSNITSRKQQPTRRVSTKQHSFLWIVLALVLIAVASQQARQVAGQGRVGPAWEARQLYFSRTPGSCAQTLRRGVRAAS